MNTWVKRAIIGLGFLTAATSHAAVFFLDKIATGSGDGSSWANAYTTPLAAYNAAALVAGSTCFVSGGPHGTSQTYDATTSVSFQGQFFLQHNGTAGNLVTFQIGQDSLHNGTAIFDCKNGTSWLTQGWAYVVISGDAGDHQQHFSLINCVQGGRCDNDAHCRFTYIAFGNCGTGPLFNPSGGNNEIDHCTATVTGTGANNFSTNTTSGSAFDIDLFHDNVIAVPRDSVSPAFGADVLDWSGNGQSVYNNTFISYPISGYVGGQHQDGWQSEGGSFLRCYNNRGIDIGNYVFFGEASTAAFQHVQIHNNICSISYVNTTQAIAMSATDALPAVDVTMDDNVADGYAIPYTFRNPNTNPDPGAFSLCFFRNNIDVNTIGSGNVIDPNVTSQTNLTRTALQGATDFVGYTAGSSVNNYSPRSTAAALLGQGTNLTSTFTTDFYGYVRPPTGGWAIGPVQNPPNGTVTPAVLTLP